ncbi:hypothetical protein Taro_028342 [Colocasia esculenta]|uniref:Uncharacterized protein n=1 Tax=Colocasia esculenta TaxID=4460 RepID=A0A843VWZ8_COLES|nr:hypothetical protein [Colocasia esculenta]
MLPPGECGSRRRQARTRVPHRPFFAWKTRAHADAASPFGWRVGRLEKNLAKTPHFPPPPPPRRWLDLSYSLLWRLSCPVREELLAHTRQETEGGEGSNLATRFSEVASATAHAMRQLPLLKEPSSSSSSSHSYSSSVAH